MSTTRILVEVWENRQRKEVSEFDGPVELGRQRDRDEALFGRKQENGISRWVIARRDETTVGRNQILLTPINNDRVRVTNGSDKQPIRFLDRADLAPGSSCDAPLPLHVILGPTKTVHVRKAAPSGQVHSLPEQTLPPRSAVPAGSRFPSLVMPAAVSPGSVREVFQWMNGVMEVMQAVTEATNFLDRAAKAVVEGVGLDAARVLLLTDGDWRIKATQTAAGVDQALLRHPSRSFLERMRTAKKTSMEVPGQDSDASASMAGLETVIASPLLNVKGEVIGALYGERRRAPRPGASAIHDSEAMLVELLARSVAAGLALQDEQKKTQEEQKKALASQVQFEQFFTKELAQSLTARPDMLEPQKREVTVMFCDIRNFSKISHTYGANRTIEWCADVLDMLSESVLGEGGVVVDFIGDGLMAMWGAPDEQPDHAARACRAALNILEELPKLNEKWQQKLGGAVTEIGVGINTGDAQVGNVGSRRKFKYGALGTTVNLASRVEGRTKSFKARVLITESTQAKLDPNSFVTRRLAKVKVVGIDDPVSLYELLPAEWAFAAQARDRYAEALEFFEKEDFLHAAQKLGAWRGTCPNDDPVLPLLYRSVQAMVEGTPPGHPIWEFTEKK
jgi:adenylate cyclase